MPAEYRIDVRDTTGAKIAEVTDYNWLSYSRRVLEPGIARFELPGNHALVNMLGLDYQIEIWRRNTDMGLAWYADYYGFHRGLELSNKNSIDLATITAPGQMSLLSRRTIAYYSGTASRTQFTTTAAETICKTLVSYNAGPNALAANSRFRDAVITGLTVEADSARGTTLDWSCANVELLKTLADIARVGGGDFDLLNTGSSTWQFKWYPGQLGADRHTTVLFSVALGNMENPVYTYDRTAEKTVAIVGGAGTGSGRPVIYITGPDYVAGSNDVEEFVNGSSFTTVAGLTAEGNRAMYTDRARQKFTFSALQIPSTYYGLHYFLGDIVNAGYRTFSSASEKIMGVTVGFSGSDLVERIALEVINV